MSRYIDTEKLKANYLWWHEDERKIIDDIVDAQPTADVRENVKGEWIDNREYNMYLCSVCGLPGLKSFGFCPNCGADMRGEE